MVTQTTLRTCYACEVQYLSTMVNYLSLLLLFVHVDHLDVRHDVAWNKGGHDPAAVDPDPIPPLENIPDSDPF